MSLYYYNLSHYLFFNDCSSVSSIEIVDDGNDTLKNITE